MVGYSGTPLGKKLGWKPGLKVFLLDPPEGYETWFEDECPDFSQSIQPGQPAAHLFCLSRESMRQSLTTLRTTIAQDGFVWVSWPKKAAKIPTDIHDQVIRDVALPMGWVDVKVCAVDEIWSGLKLVIRKSERI